MAHSVWICGSCGNRSSSDTRFCVGCGRSRAESERASLARPVQTQFALPDYLLNTRRRDPIPRGVFDDDGAPGAGLAVTGVAMTAVALLFTALAGPGAALLAVGCLGVAAGLWRMRHDLPAMERAGWLTVLAGAAALAAVTVQFLELRPLPFRAPVATGEGSAPPAVDATGGRPTAAGGVGSGEVAMFRGDPARSGVNPGPGPGNEPRLRWRSHTGGDLFSSPVVAGGRVFVGTQGGFLVAYDADDGEEVWRADLGGYVVRSTAVVHAGVVYAASGYAVTALDAATGAVRWQAPVRFVGSASPNLAEGLLLAPTQEGNLYAFDPATGKEVWRHRVEGLVFGSVAVDDGRVYAGNEAGLVWALDAATGRETWRASVAGAVLGSPAAADGVLLVSSAAPNLTALEASTGRRLWTLPIGGAAAPAVADGTAFLAGDDGGLTAVDLDDGDARWFAPTGGGGRGAPTTAGSVVYLPSGRSIYAVDRASGDPLWSFPTGGEIATTAAVVDGSLYVASRDGFLYALGGTHANAEVEQTDPDG
jgi:outer membrane protein assembly factor BamB